MRYQTAAERLRAARAAAQPGSTVVVVTTYREPYAATVVGPDGEDGYLVELEYSRARRTVPVDAIYPYRGYRDGELVVGERATPRR